MIVLEYLIYDNDIDDHDDHDYFDDDDDLRYDNNDDDVVRCDGVHWQSLSNL